MKFRIDNKLVSIISSQQVTTNAKREKAISNNNNHLIHQRIIINIGSITIRVYKTVGDKYPGGITGWKNKNNIQLTNGEGTLRTLTCIPFPALVRELFRQP